MEDLTFAVVLTAAGATASAALITGLIAIAKQLVVVGPWINADREPTVAFALSALLVSVAVISVGVFTPAALFAAFLAWFGIAQIAMGVHDTVKSATPAGAAVRDGYLRGTLPRTPTPRQVDVLAAYVAAGGSVPEAAARVGVRPSTAKRHLADLRARSGLTTEQLIYGGRAEGWLVVAGLEPRPDAHRPGGRITWRRPLLTPTMVRAMLGPRRRTAPRSSRWCTSHGAPCYGP